MAGPYKRRRSAGLIRNLWVYRRLVLAAIILGLTLWFILTNNQEVTVYFPFRLGTIKGTSGLIMLVGAMAGSVITMLTLTIFLALRKVRHVPAGRDDSDPSAIPDDRPPTDYASKTTEGFPDPDWKAR